MPEPWVRAPLPPKFLAQTTVRVESSFATQASWTPILVKVTPPMGKLVASKYPALPVPSIERLSPAVPASVVKASSIVTAADSSTPERASAPTNPTPYFSKNRGQLCVPAGQSPARHRPSPAARTAVKARRDPERSWAR